MENHQVTLITKIIINSNNDDNTLNPTEMHTVFIRRVFKIVYSNSIHKSLNMETTQMPISSSMENESITYSCNGILCSSENEQTSYRQQYG